MKMRCRRAGDNSEQSAVPCCRSKPEDRHLCVAGNALYRPADFSSPKTSPGHIDIIARTSNHRDQTSRSWWLKKLSLAERLEFVIQTTTHDVAGRFSIDS